MKIKIFSILICMLMCTFLVLCTGCQSSKTETPEPTSTTTETNSGKQTAEAYLQEGNIITTATVDLTGGWSVEFALGAIYLYDQEITPESKTKAMCMTLEEEVYNDYLKSAEASDTFKETNDYIYYEEENECKFLYKLGNAYFLISTEDKDNAENIISRISLVPEESF